MEESDVRINKEARDALYEAIENGEESTVKQIIEQFPGILSINSTVHFTCFLHLACMHNHAHICIKLIHNGVDVNKVDDEEDTPLHVAVIQKADIEIIKTLISYGADVFKQNVKGLSPFLSACMSGSFETLHELSKTAKLPENHKDMYNQNGLHQLVLNWLEFDQNDDLIDSIKLLLRLGININDRNFDGHTVLHLASNERRLDLIPCLLDLGADPFIRDNYGDTFMTKLEDRVNVEECRELFPLVIQSIQEIKHQDTDEGVINGKKLVKKFLNIRNLKGKSLMHLFLFKMDTSTLKILIDWGADVNLQDNLGKTSLHECARLQNEHAKLNLLLENGAKTDIRDICQRTPLYEARDPHTVEILLTYGSDPNVSDKIGMNPIHVAALDCQTDIIPVLLSHGTNINSKDKHGSTALHFASWYNFSDVLKVLDEGGADVAAVDNNGYTAEDVRQEFAKSGLQEVPIMDELGESEMIQCQSHLIDMAGMIGRSSDETVDAFAADLLSRPRLGLLKSIGETAYIKSVVFGVLEKIAAHVCSLDKDLQGRLMSTGSSSEGTRVGEPDEFDCLYLLDKLGDSCDIFENGLYLHEGFVELKVKHGTDVNPVLFDNDGYLDAELVREKFSRLVRIAIQQKQMWNTNELFDLEVTNDCLKPVINLEVRYIGSYFKALDISIDIVPAVYIKGWWPSYLTTQSTKLMHDSVKSAGCAILLQNPSKKIASEDADHLVRISSAPAEIALFHFLPAYIKKSYALAKVLLSGKVCPSVEDKSFGEVRHIPAGDFISSYMLKNCLLHEIDEINEATVTSTCNVFSSETTKSPGLLSDRLNVEIIYSRLPQTLNVYQTETDASRKKRNSSAVTRTVCEKVDGTSFYEDCTTNISETVNFTRKIILRLQRCIESGKLPAYFLPKLNILGHEYRSIYGEEFEKVEESIEHKKEQRLLVISVLLKILDPE